MTDHPHKPFADRAPETVHVAVLKGGRSPERDVSLVSGKAFADAARAEGYRVTEVDAVGDVAATLREIAPDVVLNGLHGRWGEDGAMQGLLEILEIPYTHSGVLASALAMDKQLSKPLLREAGIPVADSLVAERERVIEADLLPRPYVIKPVNQGSSVGVFLIRENDNRPVQALTGPEWGTGATVMVEEFIPGRELTVGVIEDRALGVTEIVAATEFYDYEAKYADGGSRHIVPAEIPPEIAESAMAYAVKAHQVLGCRGVSRSDFRFDDGPQARKKHGAGRLVFLEINTQPGMTPTSLLPEQAEAMGLSFNALVRWIIQDASCPR